MPQTNSAAVSNPNSTQDCQVVSCMGGMQPQANYSVGPHADCHSTTGCQIQVSMASYTMLQSSWFQINHGVLIAPLGERPKIKTIGVITLYLITTLLPLFQHLKLRINIGGPLKPQWNKFAVQLMTN